MSPTEFLSIVEKDKSKWINYCEILIMKNGAIEICIPSHMEKLIEIYCNYQQINKDKFLEIFPKSLDPMCFIIQKLDIVAVWYNYLMIPNREHLNRFQSRTLDILKENNLITQNPNITKCYEYEYYLRFKHEFDFPDNL